MHLCQFVDAALHVATHGPARICSGQPISADALCEYWTASKIRGERWSRSLKRLANQRASGRTPRQVAQGRALLEEILVTEIFTRVWTAVGSACDQAGDAAPVLRNVWLAHQESRHRVLRLLFAKAALPTVEAVAVNRVRRCAERWTDVLLAYLSSHASVAGFAFSTRRVREFAYEQRHASHPGLGWELMQASLRLALRQTLSPNSPNEDCQRQIATAVLRCFPRECFDATGLPKSRWLVQMEQLTNETEGLLRHLFNEDDPAPLSGSDLVLRSCRLGRLG
jgi:hypothetical protein